MPEKRENKINILIADDSRINRTLLKRMLEEEFCILEAENGMEAVEILRDKGGEIALMLLDVIMPGLDGFDVLDIMNQQHWIEDIPVIIISVEDSPDMIEKAYEMGVTDYISRQTSPLIIKRRAENTIRLFTKQKRLLQIMEKQNEKLLEQNEKLHYTDELTGCLNFEGFKLQAGRLLREGAGKKYALSYCDIKRFKFINDEFGYETGDRLIRYWAESIQKELKEDEALGRISADNMVVLFHYEKEKDLLRRIRQRTALVENFLNEKGRRYDIEVAIGLYRVREEEKSQANISRMLDCANVAQKSVKELGGSEIAFYTDELWERQVREQEISRHMEDALAEGEVVLWFQPQFNYINRTFVGAEVLARWKHPSFGWISPSEFIPILEKSGQIYQFDKYIWKETCRYLRRWLDMFGETAALAVNVSRVDINAAEFYKDLTGFVEQFRVPRRLLRLEITENSYKVEPKQLIEAVGRLRAMGFIVEMDDFGSGFSSLNMLKDVKVDGLKIDMQFLDDRDNTFRGGMILNSVIRMAQWLELPVIAEGVETKQQAEFLKNMGCELMQGYYFSEPLSAPDFEEKLKKYKTGVIEKDFHGDGLYNIAEFLDTGSKSSFIFNECIGGAILMEYNGEDLNAILVNDAFFDAVGMKRDIFSQYRTHLMNTVDKNSRPVMFQSLRQTIDEGYSVSELYVPASRRWIRCTYRWLSSGVKGHIVFAQVENVTNLHEMSEEVRRLEQEQKWKQSMYQQLAEIPGMITYDYNPAQDTLTMHVSLKEGGMKNILAESFFDKLDSQDWLHPDSVAVLGNAYREALKKPCSGIVEFKGCFFGEEFRWMRSYYISVADENGKVYRIVGRADDIEEDVQTKNSWKKRAQRDTMTGLLDHDACQQQIGKALKKYGGTLMMIDIDEFKQINDILGHLYGDTVLKSVAGTIQKLFRKEDILGRFGGDEFVVFLPKIRDERLVKKRAGDILKQIGKIMVPQIGIVKCSIGIAVSLPEEMSVQELFKRSDAALYFVKEKGKGRYALFDKSMDMDARFLTYH